MSKRQTSTQPLPDQREFDFDFEAVDERPSQVWTPSDIYDRASEELLRALIEDRRIERKPAGFGRDELGDYIGMWGNTGPDGGLIALGILDKNKGIEGCKKIPLELLNKLELAGFECAPDAKYTTKRVDVVNNRGEQDFVLLFRVYFNPHVVVKSKGGKVFKRVADRCIQLKSADAIRDLQIDKGEIDFEQQPCGLTFPDDFDRAAVRKFATGVRKKKKDLRADLTDFEILANHRLGVLKAAGEFVPNIACALLFAKDPNRIIPGCKIRLLRYEGEREGTGSKYNEILDRPPIEGTVPELIVELEKALETQLRTFSRLDKDGRFFSSPEYPKEAWYEAVVNACVHRCYGNGMKNMCVFVKMFDDRLEIESPGPFPPSVTSENIYDMHQPRNPHLMNAMYFLDFVRCEHEGTRRMRDRMKEMELPPPEFGQKDYSAQSDENRRESGHILVRVILRNKIKHRKAWIDTDAIKVVGEAVFKGLTEHEKRVINFVAENSKVSASDVQRLTGLYWKAAKKLLDGLVKKKIMEAVRKRPRSERDPGARYKLRQAAE